MRLWILLCLILSTAHLALAAELTLEPGSQTAPVSSVLKYSGQLPHSQIVRGDRDIAVAYLAGPTDRYAHGVLGDNLEAAALVLIDRQGTAHQIELPAHRVFEDLVPRLVDLDGDQRDEVLLVESDQHLGASLAVYGLDAQGPILRARSPFVGQRNRWLNPVGAGDFDGDGALDLAVIITPHIGGILTLYQLSADRLTRVASQRGFSTHGIGMTDLGLGVVVAAEPRDQLLLPNQFRDKMMLVEWDGKDFVTLADVDLGGRLVSTLQPVGDRCWQGRVEAKGNVRLCLQ